ncbi:hypothetical protein FRC03_010353 [Tulasnella sp. 419]|nr:hypothetical protein FRC03_010353 [Tulasnella sp. 419]
MRARGLVEGEYQRRRLLKLKEYVRHLHVDEVLLDSDSSSTSIYSPDNRVYHQPTNTYEETSILSSALYPKSTCEIRCRDAAAWARNLEKGLHPRSLKNHLCDTAPGEVLGFRMHGQVVLTEGCKDAPVLETANGALRGR